MLIITRRRRPPENLLGASYVCECVDGVCNGQERRRSRAFDHEKPLNTISAAAAQSMSQQCSYIPLVGHVSRASYPRLAVQAGTSTSGYGRPRAISAAWQVDTRIGALATGNTAALYLDLIKQHDEDVQDCSDRRRWYRSRGD